jgi:hypothetical protein
MTFSRGKMAAGASVGSGRPEFKGGDFTLEKAVSREATKNTKENQEVGDVWHSPRG